MQCFVVQSDEIEGRLDVFYYQPEFIELERKIKKHSSKTLGDFIINISSGATPEKDESEKYYTVSSENGVPFLRVQNVTESGLNLEDCKYINFDTHNGMLKRSQVKEGYLLTKITGVGRMAISSVAPKGFEGNINQHLVAIKTDGYQTSEVLAAFLNSDIGERLAFRRSTGGTRPALDYQALKTIPVIFKPGIVDIMQSAYAQKKQMEAEAQGLLTSFDELFLEHIGLKLPEVKQTKIFVIDSDELEGALNAERYANRFKLDHSFKWVTVGNIGSINRETFVPSRTNADIEYSLIRIDDLDSNPSLAVLRHVRGKDINGTALKVNPYDVLIARLVPTIENKKFVLAPESDKPLIASTEFIDLRCNSENNPLFVLALLKTDFYRHVMIQKSRGATPSRRRLSHEDFTKLPLPKIALEIQNKIADEVKRRISEAERLRAEANKIIEEAKKKVEEMILGD
ncbi:MAG: hypothetical protein A2W05_03680 [Candidatus Schekmanbacteria bacterium RBG_16_38_10]|uniref:Type I restriction modification DNA specificity domain-containing protein n=1 Tax=Candidatus Schekmanbacteria bacterium RBG_16_38_10 TaxID=1817879 RepID=A0A1F7RYT8_9BACT|nr:MAG: hypothetical protein A2W05_03680 [Candidatus Schekmanbacteria bacterium RBG_16_38_10]